MPGATGPRSEEGKSRTSLNAVKHGLRAASLVLPGESAAEYASNQEAWMVDLRPTTSAELRLVMQLADLSWRLERCTRMQHQRLRMNLENQMGKRIEAANASAIKAALQGLNLTVAHCRSAAESGASHLAGVTSLVRAVRGTVRLVREVEGLPDDWLTAFDGAVRNLEKASGRGKVTPRQLRTVAASAERIQVPLSAKLAEIDRFLDKMREEVASAIVPVDADSKKLARYRAELEQSQARTLENLRRLREAIGSGTQAQEPAGSVDVRLRVVR